MKLRCAARARRSHGRRLSSMAQGLTARVLTGSAKWPVAAAVISLLLSACVADRGNAVHAHGPGNASGAFVSPVLLKPTWETPIVGPIAILISNGRQLCVDTGEGIVSYSLSGKLLWRTSKDITSPMVHLGLSTYAIDSVRRQVVRLNPVTGTVQCVLAELQPMRQLDLCSFRGPGL